MTNLNPYATSDDNPDLPNAAKGVSRWEANMEALRTLQAVETEGREATAAERRFMEGYSGFGGTEFGEAFNLETGSAPWRRRGDQLRDMVTEDQYNAITGSRLNAFYTTPEIIRTMWTGIEEVGAGDAERLRVLEPSAGTGRFLEYQPKNLAAKSERTAIELDDLTSRMLKAKFPNDRVYQSTAYEKAPLPDDHYDVVISNVPFGSYGVVDAEYPTYMTRRIHNGSVCF